MTNDNRTCAYCDAPLTGRANKRYCDTSCRSKDFRQQHATDPDERSDQDERHEPDERDGFPPYGSAARGLPQPGTTAEDGPDRHEPPAPALLRASFAEQLQHSITRVLAEQNVGQLEQRYERCVTQFLTATERPQSSKQVRALHGAVRTALRAYEAHPRRGDPTQAAPQRLADLYRIQQRVDEA